jgi:hypothetical protein
LEAFLNEINLRDEYEKEIPPKVFDNLANTIRTIDEAAAIGTTMRQIKAEILQTAGTF